jgi:hypothetical protein
VFALGLDSRLLATLRLGLPLRPPLSLLVGRGLAFRLLVLCLGILAEPESRGQLRQRAPGQHPQHRATRPGVGRHRSCQDIKEMVFHVCGSLSAPRCRRQQCLPRGLCRHDEVDPRQRGGPALDSIGWLVMQAPEPVALGKN